MMSTTSSGTKPTVCRYFLKGGACYYGNDCQFVHSSAAATTTTVVENNHLTTTNVTTAGADHLLDDGQGLDVSGNDSDVMTSYSRAQINGLPSESKLHMFLNVQRSMSTASPTLTDDTSKPTPSLHASFSAMNLDSDINLGTPNSLSNEFAPHSSMNIDNTLTHSSSSPSFLISSNTSTPGSAPFSRYQNLSPKCSPSVTPSHSPLIHRRNKSPLPNIPVTDSSDEVVGQSMYQESVGGTTYYFTHDGSMPSQSENSTNQDVTRTSGLSNVVLPEFHVYQSNPAHIEHIQPNANAPDYFMPDELRLDILRRHGLMMAHVDPKHYPDLPHEVDQYHNLCPLEPHSNNHNTKSSTFGYITTAYKATNIKTGIFYCLRRIHGFRLVSTKCMNLVDMWKNMQHSNLVQLREVFTTKAFGSEHSIVFVHDYHPGATTLMNHHLSQSQTHTNSSFPRGGGIYGPEGAPRPYSQSKQHMNPRQHAGLLPESQIWAYIVQLSSVLRTIHAAGLACRTLDPTKILITAKSRLRINCCGIFDILSYDHTQPNPMAHIQHYQQEDLMALGKIVLALTCNFVSSAHRENIQTSLDLLSRNYSTDLRKLIVYLVSNQIRMKTVNDVMPMIGARFYTQLDAAQMRSDVIENELAKEVNNGRLYRLITKICMITERPEFNLDHTWSETGDRYMLKLFRDYVFHLVTDDGTPWLDMAHVVQCLNKLDAGVEEKLCLSSRDEQNVLVVSYAELKRCFETSFNELVSSTVQISKPS